jgi:glycosyltransferase involved in cell wall biosynthesis
MDLMFQLAGRNPAIRFLWIGGELDAINHWRERAQAAGLENLTLHGFVSNQELPLLQAACDVLMMPYGREISVSSGGNTARFASPMKVFEYLATGRPILSSDLPVLREVLDSSNAILLPPENLEAWDAALKSLQADASRIAALSAAAKKSAQGFTWINRAERSIQGLETK